MVQRGLAPAARGGQSTLFPTDQSYLGPSRLARRIWGCLQDHSLRVEIAPYHFIICYLPPGPLATIAIMTDMCCLGHGHAVP